MFGNLLSNVLIERCIKDNRLVIEPFEVEKLQIAQYQLAAREILFEKTDKATGRHHLIDTNKPYTFQLLEYAIAVILIRQDGV
jgi:hypothetical protein